MFFAVLTWLPLVLWAYLSGTAIQDRIDEPLLRHFGIHARFLVAIPLLIFGEGLMHKVITKLIPYFYTSGLIRADQRSLFKQALQNTLSLRDSSMPWVAISAIVFTTVALQPPYQEMHELIWANTGTPTAFNLGFGGWWMLFVSRPIFVALCWVSLWRLALLFVLFKRIADLDLELVPTHPDRAGGLGFLEKIPLAFSLCVFAISLVLASRLAHEVVYHGLQVQSLKLLTVVFLIVIVLLFLSPLLVFFPKLSAAKRKARLEYGALVGNHGRLVYKRWIRHEPITDESLLQAPEIGPVADALSLYEAVIQMRAAPIGKAAILSIALPAALPLIALFAIQVPIKETLLKILASLI
ncbi:MAG: hypothetical protein HOP36_06050 [Methyloglobulus sp.]|nr:hypothetical protein [Methyloglobulus sp.]